MNLDRFKPKYTGIGTAGGYEREKQSGRSGTMWVIIAVLLFFMDYMRGPRYSGFAFVWNTGNIADTIMKIVFSAVFITIIFVYFITKIARKEAFVGNDDWFFLIFALIISFFILNTFWATDLRAIVHFAMILFFGLVFMGNQEGWGYAYLFTSALLLLDFFGYTLLKNIYVMQYIPLLTFVIIIFVYVETQDEMAILGFIALIIMMFILMWNDPMMEQYKGGFVFTPGGEDGITFVELWSKLGTGIQKYRGNIVKSYEAQLEYATGGYYKGEVEENVEAPLGVFIEKIMPSSEKYLHDEPVLIWADLRARTLKDPIGIIMGCKAGEGASLKPGEIKPDYYEDKDINFNITTLEEESFQCKFNGGDLGSGTHNVKLSAEFNFETMGYLKTYFMDIERRRALMRDNIDPLEQYGITDKNPVAVYTNGPVKIGIGTRNPPVGLGTEYNEEPKLGITIENQWNGKIKNITKLIVQIPSSMSLEISEGKTFCNGWFEKMSEDEKRKELDPNLQDDSLKFYDAYKMTSKLKSELNKKPIENFVSRTCFIKIDKNNIKDVLGNTPIATHYYRVDVGYDYYVEKSISINVMSAPGAST